MGATASTLDILLNVRPGDSMNAAFARVEERASQMYQHLASGNQRATQTMDYWLKNPPGTATPAGGGVPPIIPAGEPGKVPWMSQRMEFMMGRRLENMASGMMGIHSPVNAMINQYEYLDFIAARLNTTVPQMLLKFAPSIAITAGISALVMRLKQLGDEGEDTFKRMGVASNDFFLNLQMGLGAIDPMKFKVIDREVAMAQAKRHAGYASAERGLAEKISAGEEDEGSLAIAKERIKIEKEQTEQMEKRAKRAKETKEDLEAGSDVGFMDVLQNKNLGTMIDKMGIVGRVFPFLGMVAMRTHLREQDIQEKKDAANQQTKDDVKAEQEYQKRLDENKAKAVRHAKEVQMNARQREAARDVEREMEEEDRGGTKSIAAMSAAQRMSSLSRAKPDFLNILALRDVKKLGRDEITGEEWAEAEGRNREKAMELESRVGGLRQARSRWMSLWENRERPELAPLGERNTQAGYRQIAEATMENEQTDVLKLQLASQLVSERQLLLMEQHLAQLAGSDQGDY